MLQTRGLPGVAFIEDNRKTSTRRWDHRSFINRGGRQVGWTFGLVKAEHQDFRGEADSMASKISQRL